MTIKPHKRPSDNNSQPLTLPVSVDDALRAALQVKPGKGMKKTKRKTRRSNKKSSKA